ncbi:hypothetical protein Anas_02294 [Armadillidium nasatum]|uniref:Uncharacterized protein n=1 Tax=Armadillidium nasatum TaxID=96803 RepID=A0A5N5SJK1_9CRUS|nr:hypothetical protein Anas_02294 [Armadillidium nasatum]
MIEMDINNGNEISETALINGLSQGDRLTQIKAARHSRSATTGRVHVKFITSTIYKLIFCFKFIKYRSLEDKAHIRTKSTPLGGSNGGSITGGASREAILSPVKASKVSSVNSLRPQRQSSTNANHIQ